MLSSLSFSFQMLSLLPPGLNFGCFWVETTLDTFSPAQAPQLCTSNTIHIIHIHKFEFFFSSSPVDPSWVKPKCSWLRLQIWKAPILLLPNLGIPTALCDFLNHQAGSLLPCRRAEVCSASEREPRGLKIGKVKIIFCSRCNKQ